MTTPRTTETIADQIEAQIRSGDLAPGSRLPGQDRAAEIWQVAPMTIGRAYGLLAQRGLVVSVPRQGTRVVDVLPPAPSGHMVQVPADLLDDLLGAADRMRAWQTATDASSPTPPPSGGAETDRTT